MAKYSYDFKFKLVQEYLEGKGGYQYISDKYSLPDKNYVRRWVEVYKSIGNEGLMRARKHQSYSFDFKLHVVELYLTTELSYQDLASQFKISNPAMLCKWVNDFRNVGPDALKCKSKGRPPQMPKKKKKKEAEKNNTADSNDLKRLQEENLKLRIENAYLKELRRLRLEGKPQKKKRE